MCYSKLMKLINKYCNDGNWNYDPYMLGMTNGLLLVAAVIIDKSPVHYDPQKMVK